MNVRQLRPVACAETSERASMSEGNTTISKGCVSRQQHVYLLVDNRLDDYGGVEETISMSIHSFSRQHADYIL